MTVSVDIIICIEIGAVSRYNRPARKIVGNKIMRSMCCGPRQRVYVTDAVNIDAGNGSVDSSEIIDIKADQFSDHDQNGILNLKLTYKDLWALGLTTAMGGHFFSWSSGLAAGFGSHAIAHGIWIIAYYCLVMCISELSSALPFAGGVYGLARVTLGVYPGFLVAVVDSYKPVLNAASAAYIVGKIILALTDGREDMQFVTWAVFYLYCLIINFYGGRTFWWINRINASITCVLLFFYIFGSIQFANFQRNAPYNNEEGSAEWFQGGIQEFMRIFPSPTRFFLGIQSINLACGQIKNPKQEVPRACMGSMTTVIITSIAVTFLACSTAPGTTLLSEISNPLNPGYARMFHLSQRMALILSIPAVLFYGNTYIYFLGQQFSSMGRSGLLNAAFGAELPYRNTPYLSHLFGAAVGYAVCIAQYFYSSVSPELNGLKVLASMFTYIGIAVSFIIFRLHYPTIKREYISPWGIPGAVFCILVSTLNIVSVAAFQDNQHSIIGFAVIITLSSLYYYFVVRHRQVFSKEEKKVMFTAYLVKGNFAKSQRIRNKGRYQVPGFRPRTNNDSSRDTSERSRDTSPRPLHSINYNSNSRRVLASAENLSGSTNIGRPLIAASRSMDGSTRTVPLYNTHSLSGKRENLVHTEAVREEVVEPNAPIVNTAEFGTQDDGDIQFTLLPSTREVSLPRETEHHEAVNNITHQS